MSEGSKLPKGLSVASLILDAYGIVLGWIGSVLLGLPYPVVVVGFAMGPLAIIAGSTALFLGRDKEFRRAKAVVGIVLGVVLTAVGLFLLTWNP